VATRAGDGDSGGGGGETLLVGSIDLDDIQFETGPVEVETGPVEVETVPEGETATGILAHVPPDIAASCSGDVPTDDGAVEQVVCDPGQGTSYVYTQFSSPEAMYAAYQSRYAGWVEPDSASEGWCTNGTPGEGTWSLDAGEAGRLVCFDAGAGPAFAWTHDALGIMAQGFRLDGDWAAMYAAWLAAGPS
jgi:hypothetical protein